MQIHITRNGQSFGPYSLDEVNAYLQSGHLISSDMAWHEGATGWVPLHQVAGVQVPMEAAPAPQAPPPAPPVYVPQVAQPYPQQVPAYPAAVPTHLAPASNKRDSRKDNWNERERTIFHISPTLRPDIVMTVFTAGLWLLVLVPKSFFNWGCKYKLTTQRLLVTKGIASRHIEEFELYRIQDVTTSQGVLGRMLGFGTVVVQGRDASSPRLVLNNVNRPLRVKEQIREQMRMSRRSEGVRAVEFG